MAIAHAQSLLFVCWPLLLAAMLADASSSYQSWRWENIPSARLLGHVIETRTATSLLSCISLCAQSPSCWTVNHRASDDTCELNDTDDRWSDVSSATSDAEFGYYVKRVPRKPEDVDPALRTSECHHLDTKLDGTCLQIVPKASANFTEAKTACDHRFGRLAVLNTPTLETVLGVLKNHPQSRYWIDLGRDAARNMIWRATGELCNLSRPPWYTGQPDDNTGGTGPEDCGDASITYDAGTASFVYRFMDVPCTMLGGYICQYGTFSQLCCIFLEPDSHALVVNCEVVC
ncbi:hypothetical protein BaRGS_00026254 [Batillaria attramentaria]|uniref:C-type lectin domain-containing protein n=1 Tax=Batillaria attramentaria TaxID=370345 RepID=A0ABD0K6Q1_9CAEN